MFAWRRCAQENQPYNSVDTKALLLKRYQYDLSSAQSKYP